MIITKSPFRISFCGGGTDVPYFYEKYGGCVLSTTINKYVYLSMHPLFQNHEYILKYSKLEKVSDIDKIEHNFIRDIFKKFDIHGVDFNSSADIPAGTGLSSSSAFAAALIQICAAYTQRYYSKELIAEMAFALEQKYSPSIGKQDQYATTFGGLNYIEFEQNGQVNVEKLHIPVDGLKRLQNNLMLFYTGINHDSVSILNQQAKEVVGDREKEQALCDLKAYTRKLKEQLLQNNIDAMGSVLRDGWELKRRLNSSMTNLTIDGMYDKAINAGADGGKLLGAGGGGFMLFYVKEQYHGAVREALKTYQEVPVEFETAGVSTIYYA